MKVTKQ